MFDLKIAGALLYDGTGTPARAADVGILGDRIADVGDLAAAPARESLDARGRCLCPGFIDVHTHSDTLALQVPDAPSKLFQGVTVEVAGNCGGSAAPAGEERALTAGAGANAVEYRWRTVAEYRACVERARPAVNLALLVGHNTLRAAVMGYANRPAGADETRRMAAALDQALEEGGWGFSTGLIYSPGRYSEREEIVALARVAARRNRIYTTHVRNEAAGLLDAIEEALEIGARAGIRTQISHFKAAGRANWPLMTPAMERVRRAIADGQPVAADRYPYIASQTVLKVMLPSDEAAGTTAEILARLRDPVARARIRARILAERAPDYWPGILVGFSRTEGGRHQGRRLTEVAAEWGLEPVDAAFRLLEEDHLDTHGIFFSMSEEDQWRVLAEPYVMIGSDGSIRATRGPTSGGHPHPRAFGAFARFLRAALDGRTVPVAEAIRKMTSLPARTFGFRDRGEIRPGAYADLVVFDPAAARDRATYEKPLQLAEGFTAVIVNGVLTLRDGRLTGARAGRFLAPEDAA